MHHLSSHLTNSSFWKDECKVMMILATQESRKIQIEMFSSLMRGCRDLSGVLFLCFLLKVQKIFWHPSSSWTDFIIRSPTQIFEESFLSRVGSRESCECVWIVTESLWRSLSPILPRAGADLGNNSGWEEHSCSGSLRGSKKLSLGANKR